MRISGSSHPRVRLVVATWFILLLLLEVLPLGVALSVPHRSVPRTTAIAAKKQQRQQSEQSTQGTRKFSKLLFLFRRKARDETNGIEDDFNGNTTNNNCDQESLLTERVPKLVIPIAYIFLASLWRGITLPFPTLRNADNSPSFSLQECIIAIVAYLSLGAIAYTSVFEQWSLVDALYFSVVSFSTVGE
jgi:hypothetical protein